MAKTKTVWKKRMCRSEVQGYEKLDGCSISNS